MDTGGGSGWLKTNRAVGALIAAASAALFVYIFSQEWAHRELRDGFRLGFSAMAATAAILLCGVAMIFDERRHVVEEDVAPLTGTDWVRVLSVLLLCGALFLAASRTEFYLAAPVFVLVLTYVFGLRPWWTCAVAAVVITAILYGLFDLIGAELPGAG